MCLIEFGLNAISVSIVYQLSVLSVSCQQQQHLNSTQTIVFVSFTFSEIDFINFYFVKSIFTPREEEEEEQFLSSSSIGSDSMACLRVCVCSQKAKPI